MSKKKLQTPDLSYLNLGGNIAVKYQLSPAELIDDALLNKEGTLAASGALAVDTGKFTGRSPKDRFIVCDEVTEDQVWWGDVNIILSCSCLWYRWQAPNRMFLKVNTPVITADLRLKAGITRREN